MPLMVIPNEGKQWWLEWMVHSDGDDFEDFVLGLYSETLILNDATTYADVVPATFDGYEEIRFVRADFNPVVLVGNIAYCPLSFVPTWMAGPDADQETFGWYLFTDEDEPVLLAAQDFNFTRRFVPGTTLTLNPFRIGLKTLVFC